MLLCLPLHNSGAPSPFHELFKRPSYKITNNKLLKLNEKATLYSYEPLKPLRKNRRFLTQDDQGSIQHQVQNGLGPTEPPIQSLPVPFSPGVKR